MHLQSSKKGPRQSIFWTLTFPDPWVRQQQEQQQTLSVYTDH